MCITGENLDDGNPEDFPDLDLRVLLGANHFLVCYQCIQNVTFPIQYYCWI